MAIHAIFPGHGMALRKMIDLLISCESLVDRTFNSGDGPEYRPFWIAVRDFSETVIFKSVADQTDIDAIMHFEVVAFVRLLVRSDRHRVDIWPKLEEFLQNNIVHCLGCLKSLFEGQVKLAWLMDYLHLVNLTGNLLWLFSYMCGGLLGRNFSQTVEVVTFWRNKTLAADRNDRLRSLKVSLVFNFHLTFVRISHIYYGKALKPRVHHICNCFRTISLHSRVAVVTGWPLLILSELDVQTDELLLFLSQVLYDSLDLELFRIRPFLFNDWVQQANHVVDFIHFFLL